MLPRTSLYCTTVSQNSIIPVQIFTLRWLFFHFTLYLSFSLWPIPVSDWLGIYHLQVRLLRWFSSAWKGFLWTLFRNFSFNNIPSMFCLFRCWSFVYKTLECLQRNFILSFFLCSVWIGVIKRVISITVHLWNMKTTHIGKHSETWCIYITYAL